MHTKIIFLNALLLTASPHSRCQFYPKGGLPNPEGSLSICLPTQAIDLANKAVEKAFVDKCMKRGR